MKSFFFNLFNNTFYRYVGVGALNTIFGYSVFSFFIFLNISYGFALFFGTILGVAFNYRTIGSFVFNHAETKNGIYRFIFCYLVTYIFNLYSLSLLINYLKLNPYVSQLLCVLPTFIVNWFLFKFWVYKKY